MQCCTFHFTCHSSDLKSSFDLLTIQGNRDLNPIDMRKAKLKAVQKQNSMDQKAVNSLVTGMDGL